MTEADDYGNVPLDPRLVRGSVLALDDLTIEAVENFLEELSREGLVSSYEVGGEKFGHIAGWTSKDSLTYQVIQHKSGAKNPTLSEDSLSPHSPNQNQNQEPEPEPEKEFEFKPEEKIRRKVRVQKGVKAKEGSSTPQELRKRNRKNLRH